MDNYDVVVIGAGTGGQTAAHDLSAEGLSVAVVDSSDRPGGVCALAGCQAKKYFYEVADIMARSRHLIGKGISQEPMADWGAVQAHKQSFTRGVPERTRRQFQAAGIDFFQEPAAFMDETTLRVGDRSVRARYFVVATGARPMDLPFEGSQYLAISDTFLDLKQLPDRLVFVGGGFISFEFAHFAARLGGAAVEINVLEAADRPLGPFDADMVSLLCAASAEEGIDIRTGVRIDAVEKTGQDFTVQLASGENLTANLVVHGAGRVPRIEDLNLDAAGIGYSRRGIEVDAFMRSSNTRVFAVGDCAATIQLARVADAEAHTASAAIVAALNGDEPSRPIDYAATSYLLFTYPQYGMVGRTEAALKDAGIQYYKSQDQQLGFPTYRRVGMKHAAYKILVDENNHFLGAHMLSDNAAGMINTIHLAMENNIPADQLFRQHIMSPYPTRESDLLYMLAPFAE